MSNFLFRMRLLLNVFIISSFVHLIYSETVTTSDCGNTYSCFVYPSGCSDSGCSMIFKWYDNGTITHISMAGKVNGWVGMGFSNDANMGHDCVLMCLSSGSVNHYYNQNGYNSPQLLDSNNPTIGITNQTVYQLNDWVICHFDRQKDLPSTLNYCNLNIKNYYILAAYGQVSSQQKLLQHDEMTSSSQSINFTGKSLIGGSNTKGLYKAHGCIMILTWMFFASTGILFARYFKYLFGDEKFFGVQFWFVIHRPVMIVVPLLTLLAFFIILIQLNWDWVDSEMSVHYVHSIFGVVTIILASCQPLIAFMRCDKDHKNRYVFNYTHRIIGIAAFTCSIIAIFLGTCMNDMNLGNSGWPVVIGWLGCLVLLVITLEVIEHRSSTTAASNLKFICLIVYLVIAISLTITLMVRISNA